MRRVYCKSVEVFPLGDEPAINAFLLDSEDRILKEIVLIADRLLLLLGNNDKNSISFSKEHPEAVLEVWKLGRTQVMGGVAGSIFYATIKIGNSVTHVRFVLAEKSFTGHNTKDLRLPLF